MVRLIVILPVPYRQTRMGKLLYREPAYLLTTDFDTQVELLIQMYLDRWEIKVNHRDEKEILGVKQAQVRTPTSVERQPALVVAAYSVLLIAALMVHGPERTAAYDALPCWRRGARRASCLDMVTLLYNECVDNPKLLSTTGLHQDSEACCARQRHDARWRWQQLRSFGATQCPNSMRRLRRRVELTTPWL